MIRHTAAPWVILFGSLVTAAASSSASPDEAPPTRKPGRAINLARERWDASYRKEASNEERLAARRWAGKAFDVSGQGLPFSFIYDGCTSREIVKAWRREPTVASQAGASTRRTLTYVDPKTHMKVECVATAYADFPAIEWVLFFENTGAQDTPVLSDVYPADVTFVRGDGGEFVLHHSDGSTAKPTDFRPHATELRAGRTLTFATGGGRSSNHAMPYFNVVKPDKTGVILAIGWSGEWAASFVRDAQNRLTVRAGMDRIRLKLRPGERVRTASIVTLFYAGGRVRGQNLWRNFMLHHFTPTPGGRPVEPPVAASGATIGFNNMTEANQVRAAMNVARHGLPVDTYWVDAGWSEGGFPNGMGTLDPDPIRFPNGLGPLSRTVHDLGLKFLLWFEPERVMPGTKLRREHPEWLLAPDPAGTVAYDRKARLLNLGDEKARTWLTRKVSGQIREWGIDIYRHDCNIQPVFYWRTNEPEDRRGVTQIRYIEGLYAFFDTLLRDHPHLLVDNCASGGRRLDIEMMRRSLPLWRSDYCWEPVGQQCMTYGLSFWLPLHGVGAVACDAYNFRSGMGANVSVAFNYYADKATFWPELAKRLRTYLAARRMFAGDYYPLTPYSTEQTAWIAWQFHRPDLGAGLIQAFRRAESSASSIRLNLRGLIPDARYRIVDLDAGELTVAKGSELAAPGLQVTSSSRPGALLITYELVRE